MQLRGCAHAPVVNSRFNLHRFAALLIVMTTLATACAAQITETDGTTLEATIVGGSPETIFVETDLGDEFELRRREVQSVRHPGGYLLGFGIAQAAFGFGTMGLLRCDGDKICEGSILSAVSGIAMAVIGGVALARSTSAESDTSRPSKLGRPLTRTRPGHRAPPFAPVPAPPPVPAPSTVPTDSAPPLPRTPDAT
jgi:hypothetical protein